MGAKLSTRAGRLIARFLNKLIHRKKARKLTVKRQSYKPKYSGGSKYRIGPREFWPKGLTKPYHGKED